MGAGPGIVLVDSGGVALTVSGTPQFAMPFTVVTAWGLAATLVDAGGLPIVLYNTDGTVYSATDVTAPTITSANSGFNNEDTVLFHALTADEDVTWSIVGGVDQAEFEISGSTLRWASNGTQVFDAIVGANNIYVVDVRATDAALNTSDQTITITVLDATDLLTAPTWLWTSGTDDTAPNFSATYPDILPVGSQVETQFSTAIDFTGATTVSHTLTSAEVAAQAMGDELTSLADDTWYTRHRYSHSGQWSAWSNTESKTIDFPSEAVAPVVAAANGYASSSSLSSHVVSLPASISAGNLLVVLMATYNQSINTPAGWTELFQETNPSGGYGAVFYKTASGSEGASVTITTAASTRAAARSLRITGHATSSMIEGTRLSAAATASPNPPSLTPSWGIENNLIIAALLARSNGATALVGTYPSGYGSNQAQSNQTNSSGATAAVATKAAGGASADPGVFALTGYVGVPPSVAITIAIRPIAVPATLSAATGTETGITTADMSVSTNQTLGIVYGVVTTSSTGPSAAQVKAGQDHTGAAAAYAEDNSVTATGVQTFAGATGLTASTTYYAHFMHENGVGNQSTVATSASFITDASATAPVVAAAAGFAAGSSASSHNITLPSGIAAGNLLIVFVASYDQSINTPAGWTELFQETTGGMYGKVFWKIASGSEGASVTTTLAASNRIAARSMRITGAAAVSMLESTRNMASTNTPNPPNLTPSWGSTANLWIAAALVRSMGSTDIVTTGYPTASGYTDNQADSVQTNSSGAGVAVATKALTATSDDPGTYTLNGTVGGPGPTIAATIAVKPV